MHKKYSEKEKATIVEQYFEGETAASLCSKHGVPRSTLYFWIKQHQKVKSSNQSDVTYNDYYNLKRRYDKLLEKLKVIKMAGCGTSAPLQERLEALEKLHGQFSVHALCEALDVSRGTFYNHIFRRTEVTANDKRREQLREQVATIFEESQQRYGANKICAILAERGVISSKKYIAGIMREMGLYSIGNNAKREYKKSVNLPLKRNLLKQQFNVSNPNRVWVSDVTCLKVKDNYCFVCVIIDLYSRKVVGYRVPEKNSTYLITSTFKQAFESRGFPDGLIFHSDQGSQYTSGSFRKLLHLNKVVQSFSNSGRPHDNAVAEAFFANMKREELYRRKLKSVQEFRAIVDNYIFFYNNERPHDTLANKTPCRFEEQYVVSK